MKKAEIAVIVLVTAISSSVMLGILLNTNFRDFVTLELESEDRIELKIERGDVKPSVTFTFGKDVEIIEEHKGGFDILVSIRKIEGANPIYITIKDSESHIILNKAYTESEFTINLKDITG